MRLTPDFFELAECVEDLVTGVIEHPFAAHTESKLAFSRLSAILKGTGLHTG